MVLLTEVATTAEAATDGAALQAGASGETANETVEVAGGFSQLISDELSAVIENQLAGAVLVILGAVLVGKLADWILRATLSVWVKSSATPLDDLALQHLSGPIVKTTVLYGFSATSTSGTFKVWVTDGKGLGGTSYLERKITPGSC